MMTFAVKPTEARCVRQPEARSTTSCTISVSAGRAGKGDLASYTIVGSKGASLPPVGLTHPGGQQKIGEEASLARPSIARGVNLAGTVGPSLSGSMGKFHAGVSQGDLAFEHKIDCLTPVRVPRGPRAGKKVHHELYHLGLQGSTRDVEARLRDNPALCRNAGIETENASRARGR